MVVSQETVAQYSGSLDPLPESKDPATADFIHSTLFGHPLAGSNPEDELCGQCVSVRNCLGRGGKLAVGVVCSSNKYGPGKKYIIRLTDHGVHDTVRYSNSRKIAVKNSPYRFIPQDLVHQAAVEGLEGSVGKYVEGEVYRRAVANATKRGPPSSTGSKTVDKATTSPQSSKPVATRKSLRAASQSKDNNTSPETSRKKKPPASPRRVSKRLAQEKKKGKKSPPSKKPIGPKKAKRLYVKEVRKRRQKTTEESEESEKSNDPDWTRKSTFRLFTTESILHPNLTYILFFLHLHPHSDYIRFRDTSISRLHLILSFPNLPPISIYIHFHDVIYLHPISNYIPTYI